MTLKGWIIGCYVPTSLSKGVEVEKIPISSWKFTQEGSKKSSTGWNQSSPTRSLVTILCLQTLHYTVNFGLTKNFCNLFCLRLLFFLFDDFYLSSADAKITNFIESFTKNQHWFITEHSCFAMMTSSPFVREKQNLFWEFLVCLAQWQPMSSFESARCRPSLNCKLPLTDFKRRRQFALFDVNWIDQKILRAKINE